MRPRSTVSVPVRQRSGYRFFVPAVFSGMGAAMVAALLVPESSLIVRTWMSSLAGLTAVWALLLYQHDGRVPLGLDAMAALGFSASALIPPLYLCLRLGTGYRVDDYDVADMFPFVSIWTTVGAVALLFGYALIQRHMRVVVQPRRDPPISVLALIGMTLIVTWIARIVLIAQGAYYYVFAEATFLFGRWYSVTGALAKYGLVAALLLWLLAAHDSRLRMWAMIASVGELLYVVPTGARKETIQLLFGFVLISWWTRQRPPLLRLAALFVVAAIAVPALGQYRYTISEYSTMSSVSGASTVAAARTAKTRFDRDAEQGGSPLDYLDVLFNRMYDGQLFGYLLKHYRDSYPFEAGSTYYTRVPWLLVPYFLYPDRPIMQVPLDYWFALVGYGSNPTTFFGESYINFGYFGVPLMGLVMGMALGVFDRVFLARRNSVVVSGIYLFTCALTPFLVSANFASWLGVLRNSVLMLIVFKVIQRFARPAAFTESSPVRGRAYAFVGRRLPETVNLATGHRRI